MNKEEIKWISVFDDLPESLERVLISSEYHIDIAQYIHGKTVDEVDFIDKEYWGICSEYDADTDTFWVEPGWWESTVVSDLNSKIRFPINHWARLPIGPESWE